MILKQILSLLLKLLKTICPIKAASNKVENQLPEELKSLSYHTKEPKTSIQTLLKNKADTSVLVVSSDGELIGFVSGGFTEEKLEKIEELIP